MSKDKESPKSETVSDDEDSHQHSSSRRDSKRKSESRHRHRHSRSKDKYHKRDRHSSKERHSSHRSSKHRHRSRSPRRRSRSPRGSRSPKRKSRSGHGSRSPKRRSRSPHKPSASRSWSPSPVYDRAMDAQERLARRLERARDLTKRKHEQQERESRNINEAVKKATEIANDSTVNTISAKASAQIEALRAKALAETGIEVPSYYNPLAVNPLNYAHQAAKRKKLWAKKDNPEGESAKSDQSTSVVQPSLWSGVKFGDDKSNEKFAKLMGIKSSQTKVSEESQDIIKKQAEVFHNLDIQYQQARLATHTQRGLGLGFSSALIDPNAASQSNAEPARR